MNRPRLRSRLEFDSSRGAQPWPSVLSIAFLLLISPRNVGAQTAGDLTALKKQIDSLQEGQKQIQKELSAIQALLTRPEKPVPTNLDVTPDDTPSRGEKTAKVTLVEYFDYQCPFCTGFEDETMPQILTNYILKGDLRYIVRDFPLEGAHPYALRAGEAARWPMSRANSGACMTP